MTVQLASKVGFSKANCAEKNLWEVNNAMYKKAEYAKGFMEFQLDFLETVMRVWKEVDTGHPPERIQERLDSPWSHSNKPWHKQEPGKCYSPQLPPLRSLYLRYIHIKILF